MANLFQQTRVYNEMKEKITNPENSVESLYKYG